jgi:hypothetical protein
MLSKIKELFLSFRKRTRWVIAIWTICNLFLLLVLILGAGANVFVALLFFIIWEAAIWGYYIYKYRYKTKHK